VIALLDVNVLIAMFDFKHIMHAPARRWFSGWAGQFASCPITELGFVRITSNPRYENPFPNIDEAIALVSAFKKHAQYCFLPDSISVAEANNKYGLCNHKQSTDRYLLRLAMSHGARLITFDAAIQAFDEQERNAILKL
jgi:uncharacterized protein